MSASDVMEMAGSAESHTDSTNGEPPMLIDDFFVENIESGNLGEDDEEEEGADNDGDGQCYGDEGQFLHLKAYREYLGSGLFFVCLLCFVTRQQVST